MNGTEITPVIMSDSGWASNTPFTCHSDDIKNSNGMKISPLRSIARKDAVPALRMLWSPICMVYQSTVSYTHLTLPTTERV